MIKDVEEVKQMIYDYFTSIFTTTNPSRSQLDTIIANLPTKITGDMRRVMDQPFTEEEETNALAQMCLTKTPGLGGFPVVFFQKHWS